jgi:hypothetical protein
VVKGTIVDVDAAGRDADAPQVALRLESRYIIQAEEGPETAPPTSPSMPNL